MVNNFIKKLFSISALLYLTGIQTAIADVSVSSSLDNVGTGLGLKMSNNNSMFLGKWRNQISAKLNPSYFNQLERLNRSHISSHSSSNLLSNFVSSASSNFSVPVFSDSLFNTLYDDSDVYFSFASKNIKLTPHGLSELLTNLDSQTHFKKSNLKLVEQDFYAPGYVFSKGNSSIGVGIILVQQKFLDNSFGSVTLGQSGISKQYSDSSQININKGTGYQFNVSQKLNSMIDFSFDYQSQVIMNEFDSTGSSYSDPGDFDIPSQYTASVGLKIFKNSKINFAAEEISFSNIDPFVHSGYSQSFLNAYNSPISPVFKLEDLTVYSVSFKQKVNDNLSWNFNVTSRQQAPATAIIFNNILNNDTASVSYKLGVSLLSNLGQFELFTSFANKPLLIGSTDFGRQANNTLRNHLEGVASWSFQF